MKWHILNIFVLAVIAGISPVLAESHRLQEDFSFRRIGVPTAGSSNRITVQVAPSGPSGPSGPAVAGTGAASPSPSVVEWFWTTISPDLSATAPGRLELAINHLRNAPAGGAIATPRLQLMQDIAATHGIDILTQTIGTRVSPALVLSVIVTESAGQVDANSSAGAQGLMQLMPATAERFGTTNRLDAKDNIKGGVAYLDWLMGEFDGDPILVLAAYNAGEGALRKNNGVPPYRETRGYVPKVLAAWTVARGLCQTPPQLVSDGCVFTVSGG